MTEKHSDIIFSIIICTYNGATYLPTAVKSLAHLDFPKTTYEIWIVDNASTDNTKEVFNHLKKDHPDLRLHYIFEPTPGLSHARNIGIKHAKGEYIGYVDDDAKVDKNWLRHISICFKKNHPTPLAVGGPIYPFFEGEVPAWFKDSYEIDTKGDSERYLDIGESFSGSNMFFLRSLLEQLGGFPTNVGMKKDVLSIGEETSVFQKISHLIQKDNLFFYTPKAIVYHLVPKEKVRVQYRLKRAYAYGQFLSRTHYSSNIGMKSLWLLQLAGGVVLLSCKAIFRIFSYTYRQQWIVEEIGPIVSCISGLLTGIGINIHVKQHI